jgi:hypothetical protein
MKEKWLKSKKKKFFYYLILTGLIMENIWFFCIINIFSTENCLYKKKNIEGNTLELVKMIKMNYLK